MTLYDLTVVAEHRVSTYKNPNISEWIAAIDPVLSAAGQPCICTDTVEDITIGETTLWIKTSYSVRGCADTNSIEIPLDIITASDPVHAARLFKVTNDIERFTNAIKSSEEAIKSDTAKLQKFLAEKENLENTKVK